MPEPLIVSAPFRLRNMRPNRFYFLLPLLAFIAGCSDYPLIEQTLTFNIDRSVPFSISNLASINTDTSLMAMASIDTNDYVKNSSSAYLLKSAQVGRLYLSSSDPSFTFDQLSYARILIGVDTIAMDTLPQGVIDTNFVLTHTDITKYMQDTAFTATLQCSFKAVPENPVTITCGMTVIYTAAVRP
jgi:hypothetical protein